MFLFTEVSKILLTEKFFCVDFLVHFPTFDFTEAWHQKNDSKTFHYVGKSFAFFCFLNFLSQFAMNTSGFNVSWMLRQIDVEISLAQRDLALIRNETAMFPTLPTPSKSTRQRCGATMGLAALAAIGIFGGGLAVGGSDSCGLRGFFWKLPRPNKSKCRNCTSPG